MSLGLQGFSLPHHRPTKNPTQYGFKNLSTLEEMKQDWSVVFTGAAG